MLTRRRLLDECFSEAADCTLSKKRRPRRRKANSFNLGASRIESLPTLTTGRSHTGALVIAQGRVVADTVRSSLHIIEVVRIRRGREKLRIDKVVLLGAVVTTGRRSLPQSVICRVNDSSQRRRRNARAADDNPSAISEGIVDVNTAGRIGIKGHIGGLPSTLAGKGILVVAPRSHSVKDIRWTLPRFVKAYSAS